VCLLSKFIVFFFICSCAHLLNHMLLLHLDCVRLTLRNDNTRVCACV
jgi:hypothetical protein